MKLSGLLNRITLRAWFVIFYLAIIGLMFFAPDSAEALFKYLNRDKAAVDYDRTLLLAFTLPGILTLLIGLAKGK